MKKKKEASWKEDEEHRNTKRNAQQAMLFSLGLFIEQTVSKLDIKIKTILRTILPISIN